MHRIFTVLFVFISACNLFSQGVGIPSSKAGIGFGNSPCFTGLRFNFKDRNIQRIKGINVTIWQSSYDSAQTGTTSGLSLGLPMVAGSSRVNGISIGVAGVMAKSKLNGINIGGLGVGAGEDVNGINIGGLGMGAGGNIKGINIGGLGAGAGGDVVGFNFGGLGVGAGDKLTGFNFGGLGVGGGDRVAGINIGGLGVGAGDDLVGFSIGGLGVGAGKQLNGIAIGGIGIGAGKEINGLAIACGGIGSPKMKAIAIAPCVGGVRVNGFLIAPAYMQIGYKSKIQNENEFSEENNEGAFKGLSISAVHIIKGDLNGVTIGVVNKTTRIHGVQLGLINIVKDNPRGLRVLPLFNTHF